MKLIHTIIFIFISMYSFSQIEAVTNEGKEVLLSENGTWTYKNDNDLNNSNVTTVNNKSFKKHEKSTFNVKLAKVPLGIYINPLKWSFTKDVNNPDAEYFFQLKGEDLYAQVITEKVIVPLENLTNMALSNFLNAAPNAKIVEKEYRNVNGLNVIMMRMEVTTEGVDLVFTGYYYSDENGTSQLVTWTSKNLFDLYLEDMEILVNGLNKL